MAQQKKIKYVSSFTGYKNYKDILKLQTTDITAGSQNVFVVDGAKLEARAGMDFFGAEGTDGVVIDEGWTLPHRIHSSYDTFVNNQGYTLPLRFYYSGDASVGDIADVWLNDFDLNGDPLTTKRWYQITASSPTQPLNSLHQIYFAQWFDPLNKQNQLVMSYGQQVVSAWTGGFAPIIGITPTTITTTASWREMGFIEANEGVDTVIVNGVEYPLSSGDFSTNTITVASTAGISITDVAFQAMRQDTIDDQTIPTEFVADVCDSLNNQVYYLDWRQQSGLVSWNRNQDASLGQTSYVGTSGLNDAVFTGPFTGTQTETFEVTIDSVSPASEEQTFYGDGLDDGTWNTSGYSASGDNKYKIIIVADQSFTFAGVPAPIPTVGETLVGGLSGAVGLVISLDSGGQDPILKMAPGSPAFQVGETVTGTISGLIPQVIFSVVIGDWFRVYKNGSLINAGAPYSGTFSPSAILNPAQSFIVADGITFIYENYTGHTIGDYWLLDIDSGGPDTFSWSLNGDAQADHVAITLGTQALADGIDVEFSVDTGHDLGDKWTMTAYPAIDRGWRQVYFTKPIRLPGEGFKFDLDSNGWALKPQEKQMYVNAQGGEYYTIATSLSADLQTESLSVERLKSESQNKLLFPYLWGYLKDYLGVISLDKTFDILGRQKFLELPQTRTFSDPVRVDFETADWEDGQVMYYKRKVFFSVPKEGYFFIWDDYKKYWHAPHTFARRISRLAIIDNKLIGHSYEKNESYELYVGMNDLGIYPIETRIVTSYQDEGLHFEKKSTSAFVCDGYMEGNPSVQWTVNLGIGGCYGQRVGIINPVYCIPEDTASLGKSTLGHHGLGNDPVDVIPHFFYGKTFDDAPYYHRNIELYSNALDQRWSITAYGIDVQKGQLTNSDIFNPS